MMVVARSARHLKGVYVETIQPGGDRTRGRAICLDRPCSMVLGWVAIMSQDGCGSPALLIRDRALYVVRYSRIYISMTARNDAKIDNFST